MFGLTVTPYPYQREGIEYGLEKQRLLIADEPGLGKTLQSIGIVNAAGAYPCLVICPASLKINWKREFEKFTSGRTALVLGGSATRDAWPYYMQIWGHSVAIINYESIRSHFILDIRGGSKTAFRLRDIVTHPELRRFRSIIIDESHRVKDASAQQTRFAKVIAAGRPYVILLSGTPVVNAPADLVTQLSILDRLKEWGGKSKFLADYGDPETADLETLSSQLYSRCMIRREKANVLTDLPAKTRTDLHVPISNRDEYALAERDLARYLRTYTECTDRDIRRKMRMKALVKFMTLRSLSAQGKVAAAAEFVSNFVTSRKSLILFCSYHAVVDRLMELFPDAVCVTGRNSPAEKQLAVDRFQSGIARLIICSIKAAGVGLTLTASSSVVFVEFPWTYADCCQCEDRAHRIGQKDNVSCYYLIGQDTIDRKLYSIIHEKRSIAARILSSETDDIPTDEAYFNELLTYFSNPEK